MINNTQQPDKCPRCDGKGWYYNETPEGDEYRCECDCTSEEANCEPTSKTVEALKHDNSQDLEAALSSERKRVHELEQKVLETNERLDFAQIALGKFPFKPNPDELMQKISELEQKILEMREALEFISPRLNELVRDYKEQWGNKYTQCFDEA